MNEHWTNHASQWGFISSPLRPHHTDIAIIAKEISLLSNHVGPLSVALLGVTPEITSMDWPVQTKLNAFEKNAGMISSLWQEKPEFSVQVANWLKIPMPSQSFDVILGDGCFTNFETPELYTAMFKEIRRLLKPGGYFIHRFFTQLNEPETPDVVLNSPDENFHAYKWRLAMSLQDDFLSGVELHSIWEKHQKLKKENHLWANEEESTINAYRNVSTKYTFPTVSEVSALTQPFFNILRTSFGDYTLSNRCPIIVYQSK